MDFNLARFVPTDRTPLVYRLYPELVRGIRVVNGVLNPCEEIKLDARYIEFPSYIPQIFKVEKVNWAKDGF